MKQIKTTTSVCPRCLIKVPAAAVFEREGQVFMKKTCPEHGDEEAWLASDARLYFSAGNGDGASGCCALGHSCTMIFEITERCNLTCPTCFTASSPQETWQMSFDEFERKLDRQLAAGRGDADLVQISGGEPTLHPDLPRMIALCFARGVRKVYVNTNGVRLGREPDFAHFLAEAAGDAERLQFYLQFDGFEERTHSLIRGARGLSPLKLKAIDNLLAAGLYPLPVMTVTRGINLEEIGAVVRLVIDRHPRMNTVILQPAFYSGRYENPRLFERLTSAEVAHEVARQTGLFAVEDFGPIPCGDPNCFTLAVGLMKDGRLIPVSRYFPRIETWQRPEVAPLIRRFTDKMPQTMLDVLGEDELVDSLLDLLADGDGDIDWSDHRNFVLIGIKPFMDAHTYDQDRVNRCCVHVIDRAGNPVSLCEYNALRRPRGLL